MSNADVSYVYFGYVLDKVEDTDPTADIGGLIPDIEGVVNSQVAYMAASLLYEGSLNPGGVVGDGDPNNDIELDNDITPGNPTSMAYNIVSGLSQPPGEPFGNGDTDTVYRLREGVERLLVADISDPAATALSQSELPVMWDTVSSSVESSAQFNHIPGGANTLYMDGHVEFNKYPGKFPATQTFAELAGFF